MLVICDFLLLSMLALARFDPPEAEPTTTLDATASSDSAEAELIELLEESLQSELDSRENLAQDLDQARSNLQAQLETLKSRESQLNEVKAALENEQSTAEQLARAREEAETRNRQLAREKEKIQSEQRALETRYSETQKALQTSKSEQIELVATLGEIRENSSLAQVKISEIELDLEERERALAEREAELRREREARERLAAEREELSRELEVARAERKLLESNLSREQSEKSELKAEKEQAFARAERLTENVSQLSQGLGQLGAGVSSLAEQSEDLQRELIESRPLTMSEVFTRFQNNSVTVEFTADESGLFGTNRGRTYRTQSVVVRDSSGDLYAVAHSGNTPLAPTKSSGSPLAISGRILYGNSSYPVNQIAFLSTDPRIIYIPLPENFATALRLETFDLAVTPERWEQAILVKNDASNFGSADFRRITQSDRFLQMERPAFGQLFADFASSKGDLAFAKNGQFIGLLSNSRHSVVIDEFLASALISLGPGYDGQAWSQTRARLRSRIASLPSDVR